MNLRKSRRPMFQTLETRKMFAVASGDFNGDGHDDMAFGVPGEDVSSFPSLASQVDAGAVNVVYGTGSYTGLQTPGNEVLTQGSQASTDDHFGSALAAGDFNGDGYDDLAVGVPGEDVSGVSNAGAVAIFYGSKDGLKADGGFQSLFSSPELWHQGKLQGGLEANDHFAEALAVGDFDNDGYDDLAVGVVEENLGFFNSKQDAGAVNVIRGSATGLTASGNQLWHQDSPGINGVAESYDHFGAALATGDFNNDGYDDLAIGVPDENVGSVADAGAVNVIYGRSGAGLSALNDQVWSQNTYLNGAVQDVAEKHDHFGSALATGDFDNDGRDDLAIGVPGENHGAGAVNVIYGRSNQTGLTGLVNQFWHQDSYRIKGVAEGGDAFGASLAAGDFDGNGYDDLAIGVPGEDVHPQQPDDLLPLVSTPDGAVNVIYGGPGWLFSGLSSNNNQLWHQDSAGILDSATWGDNFGSDLAVGDFNSDGRDDLTLYVPGDGPAAHVIYGRSNTAGLTSAGDQLWRQGRSDLYGQIGGSPESSDQFYVDVPVPK